VRRRVTLRIDEAETERLVLRPWREGDEPSLVRHANNRKVSINLRDIFPTRTPWKTRGPGSPAAVPQPRRTRPSPIGTPASDRGTGSSRCLDVARFTAEVGYWLGEEFWGQGSRPRPCAALPITLSKFQYDASKRWSSPPIPSPAEWLEKRLRARSILRPSAFKVGDSWTATFTCGCGRGDRRRKAN